MRRLAGVLVLGLLVPEGARASDAPHDLSSAAPVSCDSCHVLHKAPGATLTKEEGNSNLCASCHNAFGEAFVMPESAQASPGAWGTSHRFDAVAVNPAYGATLPVDPAVASRIADGKIQCSSCHDQHTGASSIQGHQRTKYPVGQAMPRTSGSGTGTLVLNQPSATANPKGYRVDLVTATTFRISNDNGISWFGWQSNTWTPGVATGRPTGSSLALNDGTNVTVTFSGTFVVGDQWNFYVSYPLLRMAVDQSQLCETCHTGRVQSAAYVETGGDGVKLFSHPVGEALSKSYDRASNAILDANGTVQTTGDGKVTNDIVLAPGNLVRCLTCHAPHHADSNSLTEDLR